MRWNINLKLYDVIQKSKNLETATTQIMKKIVIFEK